jgi:hypothetical protein
VAEGPVGMEEELGKPSLKPGEASPVVIHSERREGGEKGGWRRLQGLLGRSGLGGTWACKLQDVDNDSRGPGKRRQLTHQLFCAV